MSTVLSAKVFHDSIALTIPADTPEEQVHFHRVQKFRPLRRKGQGTTYNAVKQGRYQCWAPVGSYLDRWQQDNPLKYLKIFLSL